MKFTKYYFTAIFLLIFFFLTNDISGQGNHKFETINLPSEVTDSKANSILEDSKGFIWFAFDTGLVVYDGYKGKIVDCVFEDGTIQGYGIVNSIIEDENGKIWIGSSAGVFIYDPIQETSVYLNDSKINQKYCRSLNTTSTGEILIGTNAGLLIYSLDGTFIEQYFHQSGNENSLSHNIVRCSYEDKNGNIWIGTYDKLNLLDRKNKKITHFKLQKSDSLYHSNNLILNIKSLNKKNDRILLVGTETGLCLLNTQTNTFTKYNKNNSKNSLSNSVVKSICVVDANLWLGTDLGLNLFELQNNQFTNYYHDFNNSFSIVNDIINDLYFDKHRNLWIATDSGVNKIYLNSNAILLNQFRKNTAFFKPGVVINSFSEQNNGDIWTATQQGVFKFDNSKNSYTQFLPPEILHNKVTDILYDKDGFVWIATSGGLNVYDLKKKTFSKYVAKPKGENVLTTNYINTIAQDSKGTIWIGTFNKGLFKVVKKGKKNFKFINFQHESTNEHSLSSNEIFDIAFDEQDNVWVATSNGINCLYNLNGIFERFSDTRTFGEVPTQSIFHLFFDDTQTLWLSTLEGLFQWNPQLKKFSTFKNSPYHVNSAIVLDSMLYFTANKKLYYAHKNKQNLLRYSNNEIGLKNINTIELLDKETILLTGKTGFASLKPSDLTIKESVSAIKWTHFSINNTEIKPYTKYNSRNILNKHIDATALINLKYNENSFRLDFSSLPFNSKEDIEYTYILENYDNEWNTLKEGENFASYKQVRPGKYNLKVKASNAQGLFNGDERMLHIVIDSPYYFSFWALLFYLICFLLLILFYRSILIKRERDKNELQLEKLEHQRSDELLALKTRFFTNITHELKTPLTLISGPVDSLLTKQLDKPTIQNLLLVKRNTDRLKKLVNQILDIRKIEAGAEKLRIQQYDIVKFCNQLKNQFKEEAIKRNIFLQFSTEFETEIIWFDLEKVEKILFNLLSNAFKFTPDKGTIRVSLEQGTEDAKNSDYIFISVSDTGSGIPKEDQANIFDRFNNLSSHNYTDQRGTGIGLSLIHQYAALHNGTIKFESVVNVGSKFTFSLPKYKSILQNYDIIETLSEEENEQNLDQPLLDNDSLNQDEKNHEKTNSNTHLKALIVEDDSDMRDFLATGLSPLYTILQAEDGLKGFQTSVKELPDIIVSDLMMPTIDGIEFCKKLKADIRTSHIPFILLTAKSGIETKISGIEVGADAYIQKPFNLEHLTVRMKSLIKQRESLRNTYLKQLKLEPSKITVNSLDEKFLDELLATIETEMDNPELSVKLLSSMLGISSTNLYRKIKALTGQTATEFIRNIRLKRAAQLLKDGQLNVSEVMYMVGFTHRSYFTKCFKDQFGVSPKSYGNKA